MFLNKKKVLKTKLAVYIKLYNACDENLLLLKIVDIQFNSRYSIQEFQDIQFKIFNSRYSIQESWT